jgi:cellulose synthase/poly-beta-1,6-N-acetylglucosamine synthase-like glycosyltransferase
MLWIAILNYVAWFVFVFIAVVWIMVLLENGDKQKRPGIPRKLPSITILIPAHNEEKTIRETIVSVLRIDYPKMLKEVIVINDHSEDRTDEVAKEFADSGEIKLITNSVNKGKAYSLNRGIKLAKGELVACIDADSLVEPDILKKMVGYFGNPKIASVTPALRVYRTANFLEKVQFAEYLLNIFLRKMLGHLDSIHVTPGVFSVYRKTVLQEVGGFDENNLAEDMEIALKIHSKGYTIENELSAISYTYCPSRLNELFKQRVRWYRGAIQNSVKYRRMFFKRDYGNLGVFFLPMNFISVLAIIAIFVIMAWNYGSLLFSYLWRMSLVHWDFNVFMKNFSIYNWLSFLLNTPLIFGIFGLILGGFILRLGFKYSNEKVGSNKAGYFVYLILFPMFLMVFWAAALFLEIFRFKRRW